MRRILALSAIFGVIALAAVWQAHLIAAEAKNRISATIADPVPKAQVKPKAVPHPEDAFKRALVPADRVAVAPQTPTAAPSADRASALPSSVDLAVPFTTQAPFSLWDQLHEETCEEADEFMVHKYIENEKIASAKEADTAFRATIAWEKANLGRFEDTDASEIARTLREFYGMKHIELVYDPTVDIMKKLLAEGKPLIVPTYGKKLVNPNFKNGGPPYHAIIIRGYTADGYFISNDPGTRLGNGFLYTQANIMDAMHDFVPGDTVHGAKVIVVISPN